MMAITNRANALRSILSQHQHLLRNRRHHAAAALIVASAATYGFFTAALVDDSAAGDDPTQPTKNGYQDQACLYPVGRHLCRCEYDQHSKADLKIANSTSEPKPLSRLSLMAYRAKLYPHTYLPIPRVLSPHDPLFTYPELRRGLINRIQDEERMKQILSSRELMEARKNNEHEKMQRILQQMNAVVYGENISPQMREDFLIQHGCTGCTNEIIQYLTHNFASRGIIEVGAGNGQWARALNDAYNKQRHENNNTATTSAAAAWEFILAYDNMEQLPLSPMVYHKHTLPANKYFYDKVRQLSHIDAVQESRGRVLLLVYPPPGPMALETVRAYLNASCGHYGGLRNDTVVYIGEGRGGANADDAFFDFFLSCEQNAKKGVDGVQRQDCWVIEKVMDVNTSPGGKGYEKLFIFRRRNAVESIAK